MKYKRFYQDHGEYCEVENNQYIKESTLAKFLEQDNKTICIRHIKTSKDIELIIVFYDEKETTAL